MRPLTLLLLGLCSLRAIAGGSNDRTISLNTEKSVVLTLPEGWSMANTSLPGDLANTSARTVQITSADGISAMAMVTLFAATDDRLSSPDALRDVLASAAQSMAPKSVEGKVNIRPFSLPRGIGCSATFTDATLVGKPAEPGNYKIAISVMLSLPGQVVVNATVLANDAHGAEVNALFATLRSISVLGKSGAL